MSLNMKEVCMSLLIVLNFLKEKLELLGPFQVASSQLYEWLNGNEEDAHLVFDLAAETRDHLLSQWADGVTSTTVNDFTWRMNVEALKTGPVFRASTFILLVALLKSIMLIG